MELVVIPLPPQANSDWRYQISAVSGAPEYWWDSVNLQNQMTRWLQENNVEHYHQGWYWWLKDEQAATMFVMRWS